MCSLLSRVYARYCYTGPADTPRPEILQTAPALQHADADADPHPWWMVEVFCIETWVHNPGKRDQRTETARALLFRSTQQAFSSLVARV